MDDKFEEENLLRPRVFDNNAVTVVINSDGARLYVGINEILYLQSLKIDASKPTVEIKFKKPKTDEEHIKIEELKRHALSYKWVRLS